MNQPAPDVPPDPPSADSKSLTPLDVWRAYPIAELLTVSPPEPSETFDGYLARVGNGPEMLDDTLFFFLIREFSDCAYDLIEARDRLVCAISDLQVLQDRLVKLHVDDE